MFRLNVSDLLRVRRIPSQVFRSCPLKRQQAERRNPSYDSSQRGVEESEVDGGSYISRALNAKRLWRTRLLKRD